MRAGTVALIGAGAVAVGAIGYRAIADRTPAAVEAPDPAAALAQLERTAADKPVDAQAQAAVARAYFALGRYADAATAYQRATAADPGAAPLWAALGEARTLAANAVTPQAHAAFARALQIDAKEPRSRYFLAVEKDVAGDHNGALADWTALLADAPPGAPWAASVRQLVEQVSGDRDIPVAIPLAPAIDPGAGIPGPSAEQLAAARGLAPAEQDAMARGMVDRLAQRLRTSPHDEAGWTMLMRARLVLGDRAGAAAALADGKRAFAGDAATAARLDAAAASLGVVR